MATALQPHQQESHNCPECDIPLLGKHCHQCGSTVPDAHDLTMKHFLDEGLHELTHLDSKIFRTLRMLVLSPGTLSVEYLAGRKRRYVLPLRLFLVVFALNLFLYTRPGVALYDIGFVVSHPQARVLEKTLEQAAERRHQTKEAVIDQINEHWQHNASLFQLGDVFFFAAATSILFWRRYFVEHLIFSLHTLSFSLLYDSAIWLFYLRHGFRTNFVLVLPSLAVLFFYLWRAVPRMYGSRGGSALLKAFLLLVGLQLSRAFFVIFTFILALVQTFRAH